MALYARARGFSSYSGLAAVPISRRTKSQSSKTHPAREGRVAILEIRARQLDISPSKSSPGYLPECLSLNFIEVREVSTPVSSISSHGFAFWLMWSPAFRLLDDERGIQMPPSGEEHLKKVLGPPP
jgi:hypothetical protein